MSSHHDTSHSDHPIDYAKESRTYIAVLAALLFLTVVTVGASYVQFGSSAANVVIALTIATIKASIVSLFFMHLLHDKPVNGIIAVGGFLFLGIFLMFDFIDISSRANVQPQNLHAPPAVTAPATPGGAQPAPAADSRKE